MASLNSELVKDNAGSRDLDCQRDQGYLPTFGTDQLLTQRSGRCKEHLGTATIQGCLFEEQSSDSDD